MEEIAQMPQEGRVYESIRYLELESTEPLRLTFVQPDGSRHTDVIGPTKGRKRVPIPAAFQGVPWVTLTIRSEEQPFRLWEVSPAQEMVCGWDGGVPPAVVCAPVDPWAAKPPEPEGL